MQKNTAGKWVVFAFNETDNTALTGDAANITANIRIDGGAANAVDDLNPTELEDGYYIFDITAAEANGDLLLIAPASTTADIQVIGVPGAVYTRPPNFESLGINGSGDVTKVTTTTTNTDMRGTDSAATSAALATVDSNVDAILVDTGTTIPASLAVIDGNVDAILVDTGTSIPGLISALNDIAVTDIVTGGAITTSGGKVSNVALVDTVTANSDMRGTDSAATASALSVVDGNVDAILVDTGTTLPALLSVIDGNVDAVLVDTGTTIPAQISGLNDVSAGDVNAQMVDVLSVDTHAEPGQGNPPATTSISAKLDYVYKAWRNKAEMTATTYSLYNDAGSTVDHKATISDNGTTATKGEVATGP